MAPHREQLKKLVLIAFLPILLLLQIQSAHAVNFDDLLEDIKNLNPFAEKGNLTIDSNITLAPNGDVENNGEIDAGDIIRFSYTITNQSDKKYAFANLKTNIDRKQLNFIHNVQGTSGLTDDGQTISVPNLRIESSQTLTISFDARINYYQDEDRTIATESEFTDDGKNLVARSEKKEVKAKKINPEKIKSQMNNQEDKQ